MSQTNKTILINANSRSFGSGPNIPSKLLPTPWSSSKDTYYKQLRKQALDSNLDWESENFSIILPRSLNCTSDTYLRVDLPDLSDPSHAYKFARGRYVVKSMSFRSNGTEVYRVVDYNMWIRNFEENLSIEELKAFRETFLGCATPSQRTHVGSTVFIPLALPNTRYARYAHQTGVNYGVLPMRFGSSVTEIVLTLNAAANLVVADASHAPGSIANLCSLEFREVIGRPAFINAYSEGRGSYSTCLPERIPLNADFENMTANTPHTFRNLNPTGNVYAIEFNCQDQGASTLQETSAMTHLTALRVTLDNEIVIDMDEHELKMDQYSHGYRSNNNSLTIMPRIQFNNQGSKASISFRGSVDFRNIASCNITVTFAADCKVRVYSARYTRIVLTSAGEFKKYLD